MDDKSFFYTGIVAMVISWVLPGEYPDNLVVPSGLPHKDNETRVVAYTYSPECPASKDFIVKSNGKNIFVYSTSAGPFAAFSCDGPVDIEVLIPVGLKNISVSPKRLGIIAIADGGTIKFRLPGPENVVLEADGMPVLYVYANSIDNTLHGASSPGFRYFPGGKIYEIGEIRLKDNEMVYIEGGAVVRGCIRATSATNVCIRGQGILDGSIYQKGSESRRSIVLENCRNSVIEDIIIIEPSSWMIVLGICDGITVQNVRELGSLGSTDGADIVGSRNILVKDCIFRNGDDCIAIKSLDLSSKKTDATLDFSRDVENVEIRGCSFISYMGGQALEIGHELRTPSVRNILFTDCDILGVHGYGGVFGIHNSDRAVVSDIKYENIWVEHYYDKLIDFRIIKSRWSKDNDRGQVRNIVFSNINVSVSVYNPGYSCSLIGGFDKDHTIENVVFENFFLNGEKIKDADQLDLYLKQASGIVFR